MKNNTHIKVAILPSLGMGDALIEMVIANNLALNNYDVTFFSDFGYQLEHFISNYHVKPTPSAESLENQLRNQHIILADPSSAYIKSLSQADSDWLRENAIFYRVNSPLQRHEKCANIDSISSRLPTLKHDHNVKQAEFFIRFSKNMKRSLLVREPLIYDIAHFLKHNIGLKNASIANGVKIPRRAIDKTKIIIHPTSSKPFKNWDPKKFVETAKILKNNGYNPIFTVSPSEQKEWQNLCGDDFDVPNFKDIKELALFYSDAAWFIGNDSGNAHLASLIGIPTLQLFRRCRKKPTWRASWSENKIITANFPYCISKKKWQQGLSVEKVIDEFYRWQKML